MWFFLLIVVRVYGQDNKHLRSRGRVPIYKSRRDNIRAVQIISRTPSTQLLVLLLSRARTWTKVITETIGTRPHSPAYFNGRFTPKSSRVKIVWETTQGWAFRLLSVVSSMPIRRNMGSIIILTGSIIQRGTRSWLSFFIACNNNDGQSKGTPNVLQANAILAISWLVPFSIRDDAWFSIAWKKDGHWTCSAAHAHAIVAIACTSRPVSIAPK